MDTDVTVMNPAWGERVPILAAVRVGLKGSSRDDGPLFTS